MAMRRSVWLRFGALGVLSISAQSAIALDWSFPIAGDDLKAEFNTSITVGGAIRMQSWNVDQIGKSNLNPHLCEAQYQACQGVFRDQVYPARHLVAAPGAPSVNTDGGDLDYRKGDMISAVSKVTQDLTLTWHDFGIFSRWLYFYDPINANFTEYHPNEITPQNYLQVGRQAPGLTGAAGQYLLQALSNPGMLLSNPASVADVLLNARYYGQPGPNGTYIVYGPGGVVHQARSGGQERREIGADLQGLDAYAYGKVSLWGDRTLSFKLGRQTVNWGESTTLVLNSLNQANPVNANNYYRIGRQTEEVFTPVAMADVSFEPIPEYNLEAFYQLEWKSDQGAAPGSFFSDSNVSTNNVGATINLAPGSLAEDPDRVGTPIDTPLAALSNTTATWRRLPDITPSAAGQFGVAVKHSFDEIGSGFETGLYFMNYHSRLPLVSLYAANPSCARKDGNARHNDAADLVSLLADCPDFPLVHSLLNPSQPAQYATSSVLAVDSARFQLEYPKNIQLYGASFNTTLGAWSLQGEVAYRRNLPLQVAFADLGFAALGPTVTACHDQSTGCTGGASLGNIAIGYAEDGSAIDYGSSNFIPAPGKTAYPDNINLLVGTLPGAARSFPTFVIPYRGGQIGDNPGCPKGMPDSAYHPGIACYIRGYEREQVYEFNLGTTRVLGETDNPFGADQVILAGEWGATFVPYLPALDRLQFQAPGVYYHASAGADGSGADGSRRACSTSPDCSIGPDGLRFNPHQQDPKGFPTSLSWGYRAIGLFTYENVLPRIGLRPSIIWSQDVQGTSPGPAGNFVMGRKEVDLMLEARYQQSLSLNLGYTWFWGGGEYNTLSDRDYLQFFAKYQF